MLLLGRVHLDGDRHRRDAVEPVALPAVEPGYVLRGGRVHEAVADLLLLLNAAAPLFFAEHGDVVGLLLYVVMVLPSRVLDSTIST